jgi:hypothetical protein
MSEMRLVKEPKASIVSAGMKTPWFADNCRPLSLTHTGDEMLGNKWRGSSRSPHIVMG